ncbi:MAG: DUF3127 domain-containing protein [Muribaculaceae bacterium]|nr:DUF3127 domain-containing protein [Muribaculaceae bacterium]
MEITGKIIVALPEQSGTSRSGNAWRKREYVLETMETYPKKVFFNFFGDRVGQYPLNVGDVVKISFDINSREFNGRWYTDISAWKSEPASATAAPAAAPAPGAPAPAPAMPAGYQNPPMPQAPAGGSDDLPF